jgi:phage gpG-like protein
MTPDAAIKAMEQNVKATLKKLPKLVSNDVVNFTKDNFRRQGFLGEALERWPARKKKTKWGNTPRNSGRAILVDSGKLRRANRITQADWQAIVIANAMPYAKAHNNGLRVEVTQNVKAHKRKLGKGIYSVKTKKERKSIINVTAHKRKVKMNLPKRQFIGDSPYLRRNIQRTIAIQIQKALK